MDATHSTEAIVADSGHAVGFDVTVAGRVVKCTVSRVGLTQKVAPERGNNLLLRGVNPKRWGVS